MKKRDIAIACIFVILFGVLLFYLFIKTTGLAVNERDLIVSLDIPPNQEKINAGESLLLEISIRRPIGTDSLSSIELEYSIKDLDGNVISSKKESGAIAIKESEVTSLLVPTGTKPGVYVASVTVEYMENTYVGSKTFEVLGSKYSSRTIIYSVIILVLLLFLYSIYRKIKYYKRNKKEIRRKH